jgi:DNA-binding transcriptional ArsR family regulator
MLNPMVEQLAEMDAVFQALSHSARRDMLGRLADHDRTISELAAPYRMSLAAASKHVKVLERAGLIHRSVQGRQHLCRLAPQPLAKASEWLRVYERFWTGRLDSLEAMFQPPEDDG